MSTPLGRSLALGILVGGGVAFGAAAGDPDLSFGTNGIAITPVGGYSEANSVVEQSGGKLVAGGEVADTVGGFTSFLLVRYEANGTVDTTFGTDGIVRTEVVAGEACRVNELLLQPDGKLVAVGTTANTSYWDAGGDVVLARYEADGALDPTFGSGGIVVTDVQGYPDQGRAAILDPDGNIVVAGFSRSGPTYATEDALIARYDVGGVLDGGFGSGGFAVIHVDGRATRAYGVARQSDGGIVIAGTSGDPTSQSGNRVGWLARVDAGGSPDAAFGSGGTTELLIAESTAFTGLLGLPGDRLLVSGSSSTGNIGQSLLAQFDGGGDLDLTFGGGDGIVSPTPLVFGFGMDVDGNALGATPGFLWGHWWAMGAARFLADGQLDLTFGNGGRASISAPGMWNAGSLAVLGTADGSGVIGAGFVADGPYVSSLGEPRKLAVARFQTAPSPCTGDGDCDACEHCSDGACANGPRTTCERPAFPGAKIQYAGGPVTPRILWKWNRIAGAPGFDPMTDAVGFCMWWGTLPVYESSIPAGGGWRTTNTGVVYRSRNGDVFGITNVKVARSGIKLKAKGKNILANPNGFADALLQPADDTIPLHVQLNAESGKCFAATYPQSSMVGKYAGHIRRGLGY